MSKKETTKNGEESMLSEPIPFILSDESVNKSGYRIITKGIDIEEFKNNPIMFYNHLRRDTWDNNPLPIGKWKNVRIVGKRLLADACFDLTDEFAAKIHSKVKLGILNAASIGVGVSITSSNSKDLVKGQQRPTITGSILMEASVVDIPRNGGAMRVNNSMEGTERTAANTLLGVHLCKADNNAPRGYVELNVNNNPQELEDILPILNNNTMSGNYDGICELLGLDVSTSQTKIVGAITTLKNERDQYKQEAETLNTTMKEERCKALIDKAVENRKITEGQHAVWLKMAQNSYEDTAAALETMQGAKKLSQAVNESGKKSGGSNVKKSDAELYEAKWEKGELLSWKEENPEEFERCKAAFED
jgi:hypothetical protein